jgi:hypothetical protein
MYTLPSNAGSGVGTRTRIQKKQHFMFFLILCLYWIKETKPILWACIDYRIRNNSFWNQPIWNLLDYIY